jgi:hypothetical protein
MGGAARNFVFLMAKWKLKAAKTQPNVTASRGGTE